MAGAFPPEIKADLRDNTREFHLEPVRAGGWSLYAAHTEGFTHDSGQAEATKCTFQNPHGPQRLQWVVRVVGQRPVKGVAVEINGKAAVTLDERAVPGGGALRYSGGSEVSVCDSTWKELARVPVATEAVQIGSGAQQVMIGGRAQSGSNLKIELRTSALPRPLAGRRRSQVTRVRVCRRARQRQRVCRSASCPLRDSPQCERSTSAHVQKKLLCRAGCSRSRRHRSVAERPKRRVWASHWRSWRRCWRKQRCASDRGQGIGEFVRAEHAANFLRSFVEIAEHQPRFTSRL